MFAFMLLAAVAETVVTIGFASCKSFARKRVRLPKVALLMP